MEKAEHAARLRRAIKEKGLSRDDVAIVVDKKPRTITNWTQGETMPDDGDRAKLRNLLGNYDDPGDPVEVAVRSSELTEDRQYDVIGYYKKRIREQREAQTG